MVRTINKHKRILVTYPQFSVWTVICMGRTSWSMLSQPSEERCRLLGGVFASMVQAALGFICISALVIKRQQEVPRREWYVWFLDVMKQGIGASFGHFANIFLSVVIARAITDADECQWYCITYVTDSTLGTVLNIVFLRLFEWQIQKYPSCTTMNFGEYGTPPQLCRIWLPQLLVWMSFVVLGKIITLYLLSQAVYPLNYLVTYLFSVFKHQPQMELVTVMIIIPTVLNTIQFWVTDTFLKKHTSNRSNSNLHGDLSDSDLDEELIPRHTAGGNSSECRAGRSRSSIHSFQQKYSSSTSTGSSGDGIMMTFGAKSGSSIGGGGGSSYSSSALTLPMRLLSNRSSSSSSSSSGGTAGISSTKVRDLMHKDTELTAATSLSSPSSGILRDAEEEKDNDDMDDSSSHPLTASRGSRFRDTISHGDQRSSSSIDGGGGGSSSSPIHYHTTDSSATITGMADSQSASYHIYSAGEANGWFNLWGVTEYFQTGYKRHTNVVPGIDNRNCDEILIHRNNGDYGRGRGTCATGTTGVASSPFYAAAHPVDDDASINTSSAPTSSPVEIRTATGARSVTIPSSSSSSSSGTGSSIMHRLSPGRSASAIRNPNAFSSHNESNGSIMGAAAGSGPHSNGPKHNSSPKQQKSPSSQLSPYDETSAYV